VSVGLVAMGFAAFALAVRYLPVFPPHAAKPAHQPPGGWSGAPGA